MCWCVLVVVVVVVVVVVDVVVVEVVGSGVAGRHTLWITSLCIHIHATG